MYQGTYIGKVIRHLAGNRWLRASLCVLYATALILQLEQEKHAHHHSFAGTVIIGIAGSSNCSSNQSGTAKHCHTVSTVSLCAPATADFVTLDYPYSLPLPPRNAAFSDVATRPQFRPPRIA